MAKVLIIALNMNIHGDNYLDYGDLTGIEKINKIQKRMDFICQNLQKTNPNDKWIFAWRDNGISEPDSGSVSTATKKYLKSTMQKQALKYPNLTIFAGTTPTRKKSTRKKAREILSYYAPLQWIEVIENKFQNSPKGVAKHRQEIQAIKDKKLEQPLDILRNTAYIFEGEKILRHDKMAPFHESERINSDGYPEIFKPGGKKDRNINRFINISGLKPSEKGFTAALEICREHSFGMAKTAGIEKKCGVPLLHFVLSDSINLHSTNDPISEKYQIQDNNLYGNFVVHLDSKNAPVLLQTEESKHTVELWVNDILAKNNDLEFIPPIYPFRTQALNQYDDLLLQFEPESKQHQIIENLKQQIARKYNNQRELTSESYRYFSNAIRNTMIKYNSISRDEKESYFSDCTDALLKILETNYQKIKVLEPVKEQIFAVIDNYIQSRNKNGLYQRIFDNSALSSDKLSLIKNLRQKIKNTNELRSIQYFCKEYRAWNEAFEDKHNKKYLLANGEFANCIDKIEKIIKINKRSDNQTKKSLA